VHLPRAVKKTLPNGVKVLVLENTVLPRSVEIFVNAAGSVRSKGQPGLANMTAQMLSEGTEKLYAPTSPITDTQGPLLRYRRFDFDVCDGVCPRLASNLTAGSRSDRRMSIQFRPLAAECKTAADVRLQSQESNASFLTSKYCVKHSMVNLKVSLVPHQLLPAAFTVDAVRSFYSKHYNPTDTIAIIVPETYSAKAFTAISDALKVGRRLNLQVTVPPLLRRRSHEQLR